MYAWGMEYEDPNNHEIDSLMEIAKKLNMSLEELSFLWVYQLPFIKYVLHSHLHLDHSGGIGRFPG